VFTVFAAASARWPRCDALELHRLSGDVRHHRVAWLAQLARGVAAPRRSLGDGFRTRHDSLSLQVLKDTFLLFAIAALIAVCFRLAAALA